MAEEYRIEGNITGIEYRLRSANECSLTFVPGQDHTITVDGQNRAVFVPVSDTAKTAYLLAYEKKLTIEFKNDCEHGLALGESTLIFKEKNAGGIDVTIKSDSDAKKILELQIVKYGVKL